MTARQQTIVELLRASGQVSTRELAERFRLTEACIRLDLGDLEKAGLVRRFRGGARTPSPSPFDLRLHERRAEKEAIVRRALARVQPGETLYLDSGSTVYLLARELSAVEGLTIVTNSVPVLMYLGHEADKKVILVSGEYSTDDQCTFGQMTESSLEDIYVSKVFMGADSIDVEGGMVFSHVRSLGYIDRIVRRCREAILLADSTKFGRIRGMKIIDLSEVAMLVTDDGLAPDLREKLARRGIALEVAERGG